MKWKWDYNEAVNDGQFIITDEDGFTVFSGRLVEQPGNRPVSYYTDQVKAICREHNAYEHLADAIHLHQKFWDEIPGGQLGGIVCDIGLLNDALIASGKAMKALKGKS